MNYMDEYSCRDNTRLKCKIKVRLTSLENQSSWTMIATEISENGIQLESPFIGIPLTQHETVSLLIEDQVNTIAFDGEIMHVTPTSEESRYGIKIIKIDDKNSDHWRDLLDHMIELKTTATSNS